MARSQSAFTLVELVTVIAVMTILAAFAGPRFVSSSTFDTRGDLGMVLSSLRYAQKIAIAQHRTVYVRLDTASKLLSLCYTSNCDTLLQDPSTGGTYSVAYKTNVTLTATQTTLGFTADGSPTPNTDTTYTVTNSKNLSQTSTIKVEANTGYVHKV